MLIDAFDFDGTLYRGETTWDFYWFCVLRRPYLILLLPYQLIGLLLGKCGVFSFEKGKTAFLVFARFVPLQRYVQMFWLAQTSKGKLAAWFSPPQIPFVVISASPAILIEPICKQLGAYAVIATQTNAQMNIIGQNCKGAEKVVRLHQQLPNCTIRAMYTDSLNHDAPLRNIAQAVYHVNKRGELRQVR